MQFDHIREGRLLRCTFFLTYTLKMLHHIAHFLFTFWTNYTSLGFKFGTKRSELLKRMVIGFRNVIHLIEIDITCIKKSHMRLLKDGIPPPPTPPPPVILPSWKSYVGNMLQRLMVLHIHIHFYSFRFVKETPNSQEKSGLVLVAATFNQLRHPYQLLIVPLTIWSGVEQAFLGADYTAVSTHVPL